MGMAVGVGVSSLGWGWVEEPWGFGEHEPCVVPWHLWGHPKTPFSPAMGWELYLCNRAGASPGSDSQPDPEATAKGSR